MSTLLPRCGGLVVEGRGLGASAGRGTDHGYSSNIKKLIPPNVLQHKSYAEDTSSPVN